MPPRANQVARCCVKMDTVVLTLSILSFLLSACILAAVLRLSRRDAPSKDMERLEKAVGEELRGSRQELLQSVQGSIKNMSDVMVTAQKQGSELTDKRLYELTSGLTSRQDSLSKTVAEMVSQNEQRLEKIRATVEIRLREMQEDNNKKLEKMRETVDEKLQTTLENRITKSFTLVNERLEQVYKGLGEMQGLASGVGDLKKVLSNVKTRGILGEIQLGSILEQILSPGQYDVNVSTKKGSPERVEYAVKMPGDGEDPVYLPIDAKFPADVYLSLVEAYESGSPEEVAAAASQLERRIKAAAKDIRDKYIDPPNTTDFAVMFLPTEGLYAEVVRHGLIETLQNEYHINISGPTTMAALLNSLQMGFRTLAIQKRSSEVWNVLGAVKTEFEKFGDVLALTQQRMDQANRELDRLVGVRTRQIKNKLKSVTSIPEPSAAVLFDAAPAEDPASGEAEENENPVMLK